MTFPHAIKSQTWLQIVTLAVAGALMALALPPLGWWPLMPLSFGYCLWCLEARAQSGPAPGWQYGMGAGTAFGLGYFLTGLHWIGFAFLVDATTYLWMMPFAVGGLALLMALYWGLAFVAALHLQRRGMPLWLSLPATLAMVEFLRGVLFTGFPWAAPGLAVDGMGPLSQAASFAGMEGLTWMLLLWSGLPFVLWRNRRATGRAERRARAMAFLLLLPLPVCLAWGSWRLQQNPPHTDGPVVRLVQPNISQDDKWRGDHARAILDTLERLSRQPSPAGTAQPTAAEVIVWPESSVPFLLDESSVALQRISSFLPPGGSLVAGTVRREKAGNGTDERFFTSIAVVDDAARVTGRYDKWRLVPGGEFLPFEWLLQPLGFRKVVSLPESFSAGDGPRNLDVPGLGPVGMLICYEAIFPHHLVEKNRPRAIVNVTNDGWFGASAGPYQHLAQVRLRAIEQGLPVLRAANTGISAVIDPFGRVMASSRLGSQTFVEASVPASIPPTLFATYSQWPLFILLFIVAGAVALQLRNPEPL